MEGDQQRDHHSGFVTVPLNWILEMPTENDQYPGLPQRLILYSLHRIVGTGGLELVRDAAVHISHNCSGIGNTEENLFHWSYDYVITRQR